MSKYWILIPNASIALINLWYVQTAADTHFWLYGASVGSLVSNVVMVVGFWLQLLDL